MHGIQDSHFCDQFSIPVQPKGLEFPSAHRLLCTLPLIQQLGLLACIKRDHFAIVIIPSSDHDQPLVFFIVSLKVIVEFLKTSTYSDRTNSLGRNLLVNGFVRLYMPPMYRSLFETFDRRASAQLIIVCCRASTSTHTRVTVITAQREGHMTSIETLRQTCYLRQLRTSF
jgi:hypothetical protein